MAGTDHEGWFTDPYGIHEARWLSQGTPTKLVRDGDAKGYDAPPEGPPTRAPERLQHEPVSHGADLRRADDVERREYDAKAGARAAQDVFDRVPPGF
jgi:hypothetical protein